MTRGDQPDRAGRLQHRPARRPALPGDHLDRPAATRRAQPRAPHIFDDPDPAAPPDHRHFYDQIAWFADTPGVPALSLQLSNAGMFDFTTGLVPAASRVQLSWRISDHFPLWVQYHLPP